MKKNAFLAIASACALAPATTGAAPQLKLTEKNIDKIVKEMTLEEKATMLVGYTFGHSYWGLPTNPDPNAGALVLGAAGNTAKIDRLGIPHTVLADGPAGVHISEKRPDDSSTYYTTAIPIGSLISSTWSPEVAYALGDLVGKECAEYGVDVILGPGLNLMRSPLCGRNFEYFSEDPVLSGKIAAAYINGVEDNGVGTSPKHFAANNQESNRTFNNSIVSQRALRELYLKGFEIMVKESQPWTIMSSYNKINGEYTQESHDLLEKILRDDWGFEGIVMTDWTNTRNSAAQVHAGNDLLTPGNAEQIQQIIDGVNNGTISMDDVNRNVKRILEYVVKTRRFKGLPITNNPDLEANASIVRKYAPEGMVLLKNDSNVLPLQVDTAKVALFGSIAYNFYPGGSGSGDVNSLLKVNLPEGLADAGFKVDPAIADMYRKYLDFAIAEAEVEMGPEFTENTFFPRPRVAEATLGKYAFENAARLNDMAIVTLGRKSGEGGDRLISDFNLYPDELALLESVSNAFKAKGKKVVLLINTGGPIETEPLKKYADAILLTWQPGVYGGYSVADVLTGKSYPSGRLPMTWPVKVEDVPSTANFPDNFDWRDDIFTPRDVINSIPNLGETNYAEDLNVGYRYFVTDNVEVSYPFGFGLGYTEFEYSAPKINQKGDKYTATIDVKNIGSHPGKEVVQLYITAPESNLVKPAMELKAFSKTGELKPGETETVTMTFTNYDLASFDESQSAFVTDKGTYTARFGANANDIRTTASFPATAKIYKVSNALSKK